MWLSIHLPQLSLEALLNSESPGGESRARPRAVFDNRHVICVNAVAMMQGVIIGQGLSQALALCPSIELLQRNPEQEHNLLVQLALALYRFSPAISLELNHGLLLEIGRSLKLYHGVDSLLAQLQQQLDQEGLVYHLALGHTPKSAQLLTHQPFSYSYQALRHAPVGHVSHSSKTPAETVVTFSGIQEYLDPVQSEALMASLPVTASLLDRNTHERLHSLGIKQFGQLFDLPEGALQKRLGDKVTRYLQQLRGEIADPKNYFSPPEIFQQKLTFIDVIHHRNGLAFSIKRLVDNLCRFLTLQQKNCHCLHWELFDTDKNSIGFEVLITESQINPTIYVELTRLTLERYRLHAPIEAIALEVTQLHSLQATNQSLFDNDENFSHDDHFIQKIRAKLGDASCYQINQVATPVPELASRNTPYTSGNPPASLVTETPGAYPLEQGGLALDFSPAPTRPAWLLEKPQPIGFNQRRLLWRGELQIISAQENITHYWWKKQIARDYFLARHEDGTLYWVFFDQQKQQWFLHGVYA